MRNHLKSAFSVFLFSCVITGFDPACAAEKLSPVEVQGYGSIVEGRKDTAREQALASAFRRAVELAAGVMVESETLVKNAQLLNDRLYSQSAGLIRKYTILREWVENDAYLLEIRAQVSPVRMKRGLAEIPDIFEKMGKPRIMLLVSEQNAGEEKPTSWWEKGQSDLGIAEQAISRQLQKKGFRFVDRRTMLARLRENPAVAKVSTSGGDAVLQLAAMGEAEIVITGKATARTAAATLAGTSIRTCQATVTANVVNADDGSVLGSDSAAATVAHVNPSAGGAEAMRKAAEQVAERLSFQIVAAWKEKLHGTRTVQLAVAGIRFEEIAPFKEFLQEKLDQVEGIKQRSFADGTANLDVDISGTAQEVAEALAAADFRGSRITVSSCTSNVVRLTVHEK